MRHNGARGDVSFLPLTCRRGGSPRLSKGSSPSCSTGMRRACIGSRVAMLREPDQAQDVVQDTFLRLITHVEAGGSLPNARGWLYTVDGARMPRPAAGSSAMAAVGRRPRSTRGARLRRCGRRTRRGAAGRSRARDSRPPPRCASRAGALVSGNRASRRNPAGLGRSPARPGARSAGKRAGLPTVTAG